MGGLGAVRGIVQGVHQRIPVESVDSLKAAVASLSNEHFSIEYRLPSGVSGCLFLTVEDAERYSTTYPGTAGALGTRPGDSCSPRDVISALQKLQDG